MGRWRARRQKVTHHGSPAPGCGDLLAPAAMTATARRCRPGRGAPAARSPLPLVRPLLPAAPPPGVPAPPPASSGPAAGSAFMRPEVLVCRWGRLTSTRRKAYKRFAGPPRFIARVLHTPPDRSWFPAFEELHAINYITGTEPPWPAFLPAQAQNTLQTDRWPQRASCEVTR